jgi:hypothetical protein
MGRFIRKRLTRFSLRTLSATTASAASHSAAASITKAASIYTAAATVTARRIAPAAVTIVVI